MFEDLYEQDDPLSAARGVVNGIAVAVAFFWVPLALAFGILYLWHRYAGLLSS